MKKNVKVNVEPLNTPYGVVVSFTSPNKVRPIPGLTPTFHETVEEQEIKYKKWQSDIKTGAYKNWSGKGRIKAITRAINNDWIINVRKINH